MGAPLAPPLALALCLAMPAGGADLSGHGGPVRALAENGTRIFSGSFDTRAIVWEGITAVQITRAHDGAVTAVLPFGEGFASGGQDGRIAIWGTAPEPLRLERWHEAPVAALAPWGAAGLASGGWDGRIVLWDGGAGGPQSFEAHRGQLTGLVAFAGGLASTGSDLALRLWDGAAGSAGAIDLPAPPAALATDGTALFVAGGDGRLRRIVPGGTATEAELSPRALIAVATGEGLVAASSAEGTAWLLDAATLVPRAEIETGQGAVWALAIAGGELLTGGGDGLIRRWTLEGQPLGPGSGPPEPTLGQPRGAVVFRACAVCHTLTPDDGARAGPTLHGLFGRRIGTAPGYDYSAALERLDIVWTPETVAALFELGPEAYTPGSRMPEQRISSPEDLAALIEFLKVATR